MGTRIYPVCCTSRFCGQTDPKGCLACPNYKSLTDFKKWVVDNNAVCSDPIWAPTVYVAKNESETL